MKEMFLKNPDKDIIWEFDNDGWMQLAGRAGYTLTRGMSDGTYFTTGWTIVTKLN